MSAEATAAGDRPGDDGDGQVDLAARLRYARDEAALAAEAAQVARDELAASERVAAEAMSRLIVLGQALAAARDERDTALAQRDQARDELDALRATRTFRHTHQARQVWGRLRRLRP